MAVDRPGNGSVAPWGGYSPNPWGGYSPNPWGGYSPNPGGYAQPPSLPGRFGTGVEPSLGDLLGNVGSDFKVVLQKEVQLAKAEVKEQAAIAARAGALFGATAVIGLLALLLASFAAAWGLSELMPTGFAFLIVAVVYLIVAAGCLVAGRARARRFHPVPDRTIATLRRDLDVARDSFTRGLHRPLTGMERR